MLKFSLTFGCENEHKLDFSEANESVKKIRIEASLEEAVFFGGTKFLI